MGSEGVPFTHEIRPHRAGSEGRVAVGVCKVNVRIYTRSVCDTTIIDKKQVYFDSFLFAICARIII